MATPSTMTPEVWARAWADEVSDIRGDTSYEVGAERLRKILRSGLLRLTDIRDRPERFFLAHRLLAEHAPDLGPGFWIRFTVQYNLFAGTVVAIGGPEQLAVLDEMQANGELGCFGLTEKLAGVNSGLVVKTVATWDPEGGAFDLHTADEGAHKNWISQGIVADKAVVLAELKIGGKSYGPHGFLMNFRTGGKLVDGVTIGDMGRKTIGNDLDNAWISFNHVRLPRSALLNRFCDVEGDRYISKREGIKPMEMIGQRLFSGRVAVAQAALGFGRKLFKMTKAYTDSKQCWAPGPNTKPLGNIPQLKAINQEADAAFGRLDSYLAKCEAELSKCLKTDDIPPAGLVQAIAVAKVRAVETSISLCFRLKQEVGSYALMGDTGFEQMDFLQCCKFAEGDSRILMQKMARDRLGLFKKKGKSDSKEEDALCEQLSQAMKAGGPEAWDVEFLKVYGLAEAVMNRIMDAWVPAAKL